jgi:hypothetical protein
MIEKFNVGGIQSESGQETGQGQERAVRLSISQWQQSSIFYRHQWLDWWPHLKPLLCVFS